MSERTLCRHPGLANRWGALGTTVVGLIVLSLSGCTSMATRLDRGIQRIATARSFTSWNLRSAVGTPREASISRAFQLASLSNQELHRIMKTHPSPTPSTLCGRWNGINKGIGASMIGLVQDIKVLECDGNCVRGYNIMVEQVSVWDVYCHGWRPIRDPRTNAPKTIGNFVAVTSSRTNANRCALTLDYTVANNRWFDPSRFLIDELVVIDDDLLLGRANAKLGSMNIPIAFFVLERAQTCHRCDDGA